MAILNFETGKPDNAGGEPRPEPTAPSPGRVLDFGTGRPVSTTPAEVVPLQTAQPIEQNTVTIPESATTPFPANREETTAVQELPEVGQGGLLSSENSAKVAAISPVLLTTTDPQEMANILKDTFPDSVGIQYDEGGNIIAANNKTGSRVVLNKPGLSQIDIMQGLGIATAFTGAGKVASIGAGVAAKVGLGAAASGLTQAGIEAIQEQVGGNLDKDEIAIAAALGGAAEAVVPAIQALRQSRGAQRLGVDIEDVSRAVESVKPARASQAGLEQASGVNVPLFQAQQTMQPSTLLRQRLLPQLDAGSRKAALELENQNKEAFDATSELINTIAGPEVLESGSKNFRTAAQKVIDSAKETRRAATKDLYRSALDEGADVDLASVRTMIDDMLADAPPGGEFEQTAKKLLSKIQPRKAGETPSLKQLQKAKIEMHDMLEAVGEKAVSPGLKREIAGVKNQLITDMSAASPAFRAAENEFARLSPAVQELTDSVLGSVVKMKDGQLKNIAGKIFDVRQTDPSVIVKAKRLIDSVDSTAWNDLMRVEMQRRIGGIQTLSEDLPGELVGNVPGQLRRAIFGNPGQRKVLLAGMSSEQRKNFVYLDDVLRRASAGRQAGSPTAAFGQVIDKIRGVPGVIRDMFLSPKDTLAGIGFDARVGKLTDVMFNPKWEPKLKELREIPPQSDRAKAIFSSLINAAKATTQTAKANEEQ